MFDEAAVWTSTRSVEVPCDGIGHCASQQRVLPVVVALLLAVSVLACGTDPTSDTNQSSDTVSESTHRDPPELIGSVPVGSEPWGVALGAGAAWVVNSDDDTVSRVDPATERITATISVGTYPQGILATDDAVWVAAADDGEVVKIDPISNSVIEAIQVGGIPQQLAASPGAIWVTTLHEVVRIDEGTTETTSVLTATGDDDLAWIAADNEDVWASTHGGSVFHIDAADNSVADTIDLGHDVGGLAVTAEAVWISHYERRGAVTRLDPDSGEILSTVEVPGGARAIAANESAVWVTSDLGGVLTRIDPDTSTVTGTVTIGDGAPSSEHALPGAAADASAVWVTRHARGTVVRVEPGLP